MLPHTLSFVTNLHAHNSREWFEDHRQDYLEAKEEFESFVNLLIAGIRRFDPEIGWITARDTIFRIFRDTRFSPNKTPYKNHFAAYIANGGRKSPFAGYYLHVEPKGAGYLNGSLLSGGIYAPESGVLRLLREEIVDQYNEFLRLTADPDFSGRFTWFPTDMLKTVPRGFQHDFAGEEWLRRKDYCYYVSVEAADLTADSFLDQALEAFSQMAPVNRFLNRALDAGNG